MKLLLDTHTVIWFLNGEASLSKVAKEAILNPSNDCFVSFATIWEISIKNSIGKLPLSRPFSELRYQLTENGFKDISIRFEHFEFLNRLPFYHRDPFDRFLIAQATMEGMIIVGKDPLFQLYEIPLLW